MEELTIRLMEELRKNAILLRRCFHRPGPQVGQHSRLLTILLENPGISQRALSDLLHIRPQSMGEQLTKLENSGQLVRQLNPHDRRVFNLYLTDEGVQAAKAVDAQSEATRQQIFADMTEADASALLALLEKLNASIRNNIEPERLAPPPPPGHRHPHFHPEFPEE